MKPLHKIAPRSSHVKLTGRDLNPADICAVCRVNLPEFAKILTSASSRGTSPASLLDPIGKLGGEIRPPAVAPALRRRVQVPSIERVSRNHRGSVEDRRGIETKSVMPGTECGRVIR